jgi:hypothetical protein
VIHQIKCLFTAFGLPTTMFLVKERHNDRLNTMIFFQTMSEGGQTMGAALQTKYAEERNMK